MEFKTYKSALIDLKERNINPDFEITFSFIIHSPTEAIANCIANELRAKKKFGIVTKIDKVKGKSFFKKAEWKILVVSKEVEFKEVSEEFYYEIVGWVYAVSIHYTSTIVVFGVNA